MAGEMAEQGQLGSIVEKVEQRADAGEPVSLELIQELAGGRAAGPMLLLPALLAMSPLTVIPGVPTLVGLNTVLVAGQVALGRRQIWLPGWLKRLELKSKHAERLVQFLKPITEVADEVVKPRATFITAWPLRRLGAAVCVLVGLCMPVMEVVPFTSTWAGVVIGGYALAITARDGFLALAWAGLVAAIATVLLVLLS